MEGLLSGSGLAFEKQGSVLQPARARSHRSCQPVPEPHTGSTHTPNKGETRTMGEEGLHEDRAARKAGKSS